MIENFSNSKNKPTMKYLRVTVYDYKGGELDSEMADTLSKLIDTEETESDIEADMDRGCYASDFLGRRPTKFFYAENDIVEMSFKDVLNTLAKEGRILYTKP